MLTSPTPTPTLMDMDRLLALRRFDLATDLALQSKSKALCQHVLARAGWEMLFSTLRPQLHHLLDASLPDAALPDEAHYGLQLAWTVEAQRLPHQVERALAARPMQQAGLQSLLQSRCAQMYDDTPAALAWAQAAVRAHAGTLQPLGLWARFALGFSLLDAGRPQAAVEPLTLALKGAHRDGLVILQMDALHVLARAHDEMANDAQAQACIEGLEALASQHSLNALPALDSLRRLAAHRALRGACVEPVSGLTRTELTATMTFPDLALLVQQALVDGRLDRAGEAIRELRQREAQSYCPQKWRNELSYLEMSWAARLGQLVQSPPAESDAFVGLYALQRAVMRAGAALLSDTPWPAADLDALASELRTRALHRLHGRLILVRALSQPSRKEQDADLLEWLCSSPLDTLDALWLAPPLLAGLEQLLRSPQWRGDAAVRVRAQTLVQRLLGPPASALASSNASGVRAPPLDLTLREWQVLCLIGQQLSNAQIANSLCLSLATIKTHINRVYCKLGIQQRIEAVQRARALVSIHGAD